MTLLTACKALAKNVGLAVPDAVVTSTAREWVEALQFANETGEELARRVDWPELRATQTLTGDGTDQTYSLAAAFDHLPESGAVIVGTSILRPLSQAEWQTLTMAEGTPRYYLLEDDQIRLFPYLATSSTATLNYQSNAFCSAGSAFAADDNTLTIDEDLFTKGLIVRWRRQKGMDYADYEAEYEAAIQDLARFSTGARL